MLTSVNFQYLFMELLAKKARKDLTKFISQRTLSSFFIIGFILFSFSFSVLVSVSQEIPKSEQPESELPKSQPIESLAQEHLDKKEPFLALKLLAEEGVLEISEESFSKIEKSLSIIKDLQSSDPAKINKDWLFDEKRISLLVNNAEKFKKELAKTTAEIFSNRIFYLLNENDLKTCEKYFQYILDRRPDPDNLNNKLRYQIALSADTPEEKLFASGRISELHSLNALSFYRHLRLFHLGYYGWFRLFFFYFFILGFLLFSYFYFFNKRVFIKLPSLAKSERDKPTEKPKGPKQELQLDDEYTHLLKFFGLSDTATEADIKSSFRQIVKKLHPDSKKERSPEDTEEFIRIKKAYNRLLEIRSSWFGSFKK